MIELDCSPKGRRSTSKKLETPPSSPKQTRLRSPTKSKIRIPATPHREVVDAFWSQEETNNWNDQYFPRKEKSSSRTVIELLQDFDDSDDEQDRSRGSSSSSDIELIPKTDASMPTTPKPLSKTAIKKAEAEKNRAAKARRLSFNNKKAEFAQNFFNALDQAASGGEVSRLAEPTGGVTIVWSKTLNTTAGRARWRGERVVSHGPNGETRGLSKIRHHASIELAEKIIDDEYRLINTLAHEYCHLANYMVSNVHDNPHGASFKGWGKKCAEVMKDHPIYGGKINVTTKHTYQIDYKYVWNCMSCGQEYCRHSKSIDTGRSRCGVCRGVLQQTKPKPRNVSPKKSAATPGQRKILDDVTRNLDGFVF
jgi:predicted SprT family Zn-dependent metalloprotease